MDKNYPSPRAIARIVEVKHRAGHDYSITKSTGSVTSDY